MKYVLPFNVIRHDSPLPVTFTEAGAAGECNVRMAANAATASFAMCSMLKV